MVGVWYRFDLCPFKSSKNVTKTKRKNHNVGVASNMLRKFPSLLFCNLASLFSSIFQKKTGVEWFAGECRWKSPRLHRLHRHRLWLVRMKNCFELTKWSWLPQTIHPNPNINFKEIIWLGNGVIEVFVELEVNLEVHTVGGWGHEAIASALSLRPGPKFLIKWSDVKHVAIWTN